MTSGEHTEQENNTKRAGRRQRGGEGIEEREKIHVQQRGLRGSVAWHCRGLPRAAPQVGGGTGQEHRTEPRQMAMQCCFLVHGGCPPASITQKRPNNGQVSVHGEPKFIEGQQPYVQ